MKLFFQKIFIMQVLCGLCILHAETAKSAQPLKGIPLEMFGTVDLVEDLAKDTNPPLAPKPNQWVPTGGSVTEDVPYMQTSPIANPASDKSDISFLPSGDIAAARKQDATASSRETQPQNYTGENSQVGDATVESITFAPGNKYVKLEDDTYGWLMSDGKYYWMDTDGSFQPVDMTDYDTGSSTYGTTNYYSGSSSSDSGYTSTEDSSSSGLSSSGTSSSSSSDSLSSLSSSSSGSIVSSGTVQLPKGTGLPETELKQVLIGLVYWLIAAFGFVAIISFIVSGIMYLVSAGDKTAADKAKKQMEYSIIGVIVGLSGLIIINAVTNWLKGGTKF